MAPAAGDKAKAAASTSKWSVFKPSTWGQGKKVKVAHLPEGESNMYYHPELKRWVERGKEDEAANDPGNAPPPTTTTFSGAQRSVSSNELAGPHSAPSGTRKALSSRYVLQNNLSVSSSTSDLADAGRSASSTLVPPGTSPSPRDSMAGGTAPPAGAPKGFFVPPASSTDGTAAAAATGGFKFFVPPAVAAEPEQQQQQQQQGSAWSGYASSAGGAKKPRAKRDSSTGAAGGMDSNSSTPPLSSTGDLPAVAAAAAANGWGHTEASDGTSAHAPAQHGAEANGTAAMHEDHMHAMGDPTGSANGPPPAFGYTNSWGSAQGHTYSADPEGSAAGSMSQLGAHGIVSSTEGQNSAMPAEPPNSWSAQQVNGYEAMDAQGGDPAQQQHQQQQPSYGTEHAGWNGTPSGNSGAAATESGAAAVADAAYGAAYGGLPAQASAGRGLQAQCSLGRWAAQGAGFPESGGAEQAAAEQQLGSATDALPGAGSASAAAAAGQAGAGAAAIPPPPSSQDARAAPPNAVAAGGAAGALQGAAKGLHSKGRELLGALAGYVASGGSGLSFATGSGAADDGSESDAWGFDAAMHPGCPAKLDGPLPWELPEHLRYSDEFLSFCTAWQRNNPGKTYRPEMLLPAADEAAVAAAAATAVREVGVEVQTREVVVTDAMDAVVAASVTQTVVASVVAAAEDGGTAEVAQSAWMEGYLQRKQEGKQQQQQQQQQQQGLVQGVPKAPSHGVALPAANGWGTETVDALPIEADAEGGFNGTASIAHTSHPSGADGAAAEHAAGQQHEAAHAVDPEAEGGGVAVGGVEQAGGEAVMGQLHWGSQQQQPAAAADGSWFDRQGSQQHLQQLEQQPGQQLSAANALVWEEQQQQQRWQAYYAQQQLEPQQPQQQVQQADGQEGPGGWDVDLQDSEQAQVQQQQQQVVQELQMHQPAAEKEQDAGAASEQLPRTQELTHGQAAVVGEGDGAGEGWGVEGAAEDGVATAGVAGVASVAPVVDPEAHAVVDQVVSDLVSSLEPRGGVGSVDGWEREGQGAWGMSVLHASDGQGMALENGNSNGNGGGDFHATAAEAGEEGMAAALPATREEAADYLLQLLQGVQAGSDGARDGLQHAAALLASAVQQQRRRQLRDGSDDGSGSGSGSSPAALGINGSSGQGISHGGAARDTPTKPTVDTAALQTPQRAPAATPFKAGAAPSPSPSPEAAYGQAQHQEEEGQGEEQAAAGLGGGAAGAHTPEYRGSPGGVSARGSGVERREGESDAGDGGYAAALAAMRAELQADFDAQLAERTAQLEAHFDAKLQEARTELQKQYDRQLAERDAEIEAQRCRCDELQEDLDQLLLCLGQESRKVNDLADAMRQAGLDPDAIILPIEEEYAMMDAAPGDEEEEEEGVC